MSSRSVLVSMTMGRSASRLNPRYAVSAPASDTYSGTSRPLTPPLPPSPLRRPAHGPAKPSLDRPRYGSAVAHTVVL